MSARRLAATLVGTLVVLVGVVGVAASGLGQLTWITTTGTSMQPEISPGTLVVVQKRASYGAGDVVAYKSSQLGQTVLHRVIDVGADGRLVLKGDANDWVDPVSPLPSEIVGERALQLAGAGRVVDAAQSPVALGIAFALAGLVFLPQSSTSRRGRRRDGQPRRWASSRPSSRSGGPDTERLTWRERLRAAAAQDRLVDERFALPLAGPTWEPDPEPQPQPQPQPRTGSGAVPGRERIPAMAAKHDEGFLVVHSPLRASPAVETAVAASAAGCLVLGLLATAGPFVRQESSPRKAEHVVTWSYDADAKPGVVYPDGIAQTGDPLYHRLVRTADVAAALELTAPPSTELSGSWRLAVTLADESGWERQTYLGRERPVATAPSLSVRVPTVELLALAQRATAESGVESTGRKLTVQALLDLTLTADGRATPLSAAPRLEFTLDERQARLADPAQLEQRGELALPAAVIPKEFALLGVTLPAGQVRLAALGGGLLSLLVLALLRGGRRNEDEDARIARTSGHLLVEMHDLDEPKRTVDVASFDALAAIAARYERMVLFGDCDGLRVYLVLEDGVAYRYYSQEAAARLAAASAPAPAATGQSWTIPQQRQPEPEPARRR